MSRIALSLSLALVLGLPVAANADQSINYTTQNGTTIVGDYTCGTVNDLWTCTLTSQWTGAQNGLTGTRDRTVTFQPGQPRQIDLSGTRFTGQDFTHSRTRSWGRWH